MRRTVVKFGGTSLEDGSLVRKAAKSIKDELEDDDTQIAVVVSAMGNTTDALIEAAKESTRGELSEEDLDSIMAMGEKTSARIFAAALRSFGVDSQPVTPETPEWPIITDTLTGDTVPDLDKSESKAKEEIVPLLEEGVVPVVCGFLGMDEDGTLTTLGRGGSDITAFFLSKCIDATDVILVTDAEGVMSADPRRIENCKLLEKISSEEFCDLARYGAKIVHPHALRYKNSDVNAKVIHFRHGNLSSEGTIIEGSLSGTDSVKAELYPEPLAMLTVVGESMQETPGVLIDALKPLSAAGINIFGVSIGPRSFSLYVTAEKSQEGLEILHDSIDESGVMKSTTSESGIGMIVTESERFINTPGVIAKLSDPLADEGINVIEIYSSQASISFFVDWGDREEAFELIKKSIEEVV